MPLSFKHNKRAKVHPLPHSSAPTLPPRISYPTPQQWRVGRETPTQSLSPLYWYSRLRPCRKFGTLSGTLLLWTLCLCFFSVQDWRDVWESAMKRDLERSLDVLNEKNRIDIEIFLSFFWARSIRRLEKPRGPAATYLPFRAALYCESSGQLTPHLPLGLFLTLYQMSIARPWFVSFQHLDSTTLLLPCFWQNSGEIRQFWVSQARGCFCIWNVWQLAQK